MTQRLNTLEAAKGAMKAMYGLEAYLATWAESVTLVTEGHVPDEVFEEARRQFDDAELANLTLAVVAINGWNRLSIAFRAVPGTYRAAAEQAAPEA